MIKRILLRPMSLAPANIQSHHPSADPTGAESGVKSTHHSMSANVFGCSSFLRLQKLAEMMIYHLIPHFRIEELFHFEENKKSV